MQARAARARALAAARLAQPPSAMTETRWITVASIQNSVKIFVLVMAEARGASSARRGGNG